MERGATVHSQCRIAGDGADAGRCTRSDGEGRQGIGEDDVRHVNDWRRQPRRAAGPDEHGQRAVGAGGIGVPAHVAGIGPGKAELRTVVELGREPDSDTSRAFSPGVAYEDLERRGVTLANHRAAGWRGDYGKRRVAVSRRRRGVAACRENGRDGEWEYVREMS